VTDIFLAESVPVVSVQPSASAHCWDGELISMATEPIELMLRETTERRRETRIGRRESDALAI